MRFMKLGDFGIADDLGDGYRCWTRYHHVRLRSDMYSQIGVNERCDALMHVMLGGTLVVPIFAKILQWTRKIAST